MHEISLCQALVRLIEEASRREGFERVRRVVVELGVLGHADPRALEFAFDASVRGTCAHGATLEVREIPARAWCLECDGSVAPACRGAACPACGGHLMLAQGEEMRLAELEVI